MRTNLISCDQQPVQARFGEAYWLNDFVTPDNPEVLLLRKKLANGLVGLEDRVYSYWQYVAKLRYEESISGSMTVEGQTVKNRDLWLYPAETIQFEVGNCFCKSVLLASLVKNDIGDTQVVLGNLITGGDAGGHAWVKTRLWGKDVYLESTQPNLTKPFIDIEVARAYSPVVVFNEKDTSYVPGATIYGPLMRCAIQWLEDYLCRYCMSL